MFFKIFGFVVIIILIVAKYLENKKNGYII